MAFPGAKGALRQAVNFSDSSPWRNVEDQKSPPRNASENAR
jgi:hypothetical protein